MQPAILLMLALSFPAADMRPEDVAMMKLLEVEEPIARARRKQIEAELATLDRTKLEDDEWAKEWAGVYAAGVLTPDPIISVAPHSGLAYSRSGCLGPYDTNHGEIVETFPGGIRVQLAVPRVKSWDPALSSKLFFVRWGQRKYLVPEGLMSSLVSNYNCGGTIREHMPGIPIRSWLVEGNDLKRHSSCPPGRPELPAEFARMIIEKPTRLRITSIKTATQKKAVGPSSIVEVSGEVALDAGRDRGLLVGLFIDFSREKRYGWVHLTEVEETKSRGEFEVNLCDKSAPPLKVGTEIFLPGAQPDVAAMN
jgi:hypothetical protein